MISEKFEAGATVKDELAVTHPGTYILRWDNTHSRMRGKQITYVPSPAEGVSQSTNVIRTAFVLALHQVQVFDTHGARSCSSDYCAWRIWKRRRRSIASPEHASDHARCCSCCCCCGVFGSRQGCARSVPSRALGVQRRLIGVQSRPIEGASREGVTQSCTRGSIGEDRNPRGSASCRQSES